MFKKIFWWFLYTNFGQWISTKFSGGWCFLKPGDPRFKFTPEHNSIRYLGDQQAALDRGLSFQRNQWTVWIIFKLASTCILQWVVIDTHNGKRLLMTKPLNGVVAIRAGHENAIIRVAVSTRQRVPPALPIFLGRWEENKPWTFPDGQEKDQVIFI